MQGVYVTRDSMSYGVYVVLAHVGIRKFHGCVQWGAAWNKYYSTAYLFPSCCLRAKYLYKYECRERFGFYPRAGTAWWVSDRKRAKIAKLPKSEQAKTAREIYKKVDIDFSP